jgi:hypothetical protein
LATHRETIYRLKDLFDLAEQAPIVNGQVVLSRNVLRAIRITLQLPDEVVDIVLLLEGAFNHQIRRVPARLVALNNLKFRS